ncbi:MAG TPA: rhomboid family intramembrane serine protease [Terriglobales bacterium]|nr:rhomboid family intramembrane serine protease [Terriglobales bacterium]
MNRCVACGREFSGQGELCPECQAQGHIRPAPATAMETARMHEVTVFIIGVNVLVFILMVALGASFTNPSRDYVMFFGGSQGYRVMRGHEYWRLLTANYVHWGAIHLTLNMYCLWGLGQLLELFYSRRDYFLLYSYTGMAGALLSVALHPEFVVSAGASGAVFGVAGVLLTTLKFGHLPLPAPARSALFKSILQFAGINLVLGFAVLRVDNAGHLGGLLSGLLAGALLGKHLDGSEASAAHRTRAWVGLWVGLAILVWLVKSWRVG